MTRTETDEEAARLGAPRGVSALLSCGVAAGPLYVLVGLLQIATREGFDIRVHALSLLSNGEGGWLQVANFLVCGALVVLGAVGCRKASLSQTGGTWGPILLAVYGLGMIGAGIFRADPASGFPPGTAAPESLSQSGLLHFVFGGTGFYALGAVCLVFARRFSRGGRKALARYSLVTGLFFLAAFAAVASGATVPAVMVTFYIAVAWVWCWHTIVFLQMTKGVADALDRSGLGQP